MLHSTIKPRRLRRFADVTGSHTRSRYRALTEAKLRAKIREDDPAVQTDKAVDLKFGMMALKMNLPYDERAQRLSEFADTLLSVEGSDVMLVALWVPTEE